jgi:predicted MFS family arabinose efflux permease
MLDRRSETSLESDEACAAGARPRGLHRYSMLAPFQSRSYRFQWPADLLTSWAFEMETLILGWYVLVETQSVLWLTVFGALQYLGTLIAPLMGVASDRIGHRNLLCGMRALYAVFALTLMALAFAGAVTPLVVLVVTGLTGMVRPSDLGVRSALVAETVPNDQLIGAMSISRTTTDSARIAGALAGAGVFAMFGMGPAYAIIAGFYVLGGLMTLGVAAPTRQVSLAMTPESSSPWRDLKEGLAHVWNTPSLLAVAWLAFLANLTAFPVTNGLLPYVAKDVYGLDQTGLGYLVASFAGGALIGSIALSHVGVNARLSRVMIVSTLVWYGLLLVFAQMRGPIGGAVCLILAGFMQSLCMVSLSIVLLRAAGEKFRGRVMGVRMMAIYSLPIGLLAGGVLIERIGYGAMASLYAVIGLVFTVIIALRWRADLWRV